MIAYKKVSVRDHTLARAIAHYYCSEWSEFKNRMGGFYWPMDDRLQVALSFSLLRLGESEKAHKVIQALEKDLVENGKKGSITHINTLRVRAKACLKDN